MGRRAPVTFAAAFAALAGIVLAAGMPAHAASAGSSGWSATHTLTRTFADPSGPITVDQRDVTVNVDKTQDLHGRERVAISWSGAHPSGARAANPYGEGGLAQEYPVVIMQCRGVDDPSLPAAQQLRPETCWSSTRLQRSATVAGRVAVWRHDALATPEQRAQITGAVPYPSSCPDPGIMSVHLTPFLSAKGTVYNACSADTMPPEAAVGATFPPAETAAFTDSSGAGNVQFEVRSAVENESLGCSNTVRCSIVVIPIMGISCVDRDPECRKTGRFLSGSSNFAGEGVDDSVSPAYWWSASNWAGRFSIPLTFALPPGACDLLDSRAPTGFYGSELMSQAALQWSPAYCLRKDRFKFQHNRMPDDAAFSLMDHNGGLAAFVSSAKPASGSAPVGYAPTAVTGFGIAYTVDKPDNAGEQEHLRLTPRLIAKLLTESYPASDLGRQRPGLAHNPVSINLDPEFIALNPGLDQIAREAGATLLSLSDSSDVVRTLTDYVAADPEARDFIAGKPDPWGMVVNPAYQGIALPVSEWPLLDTFVPTSQQECAKQNPTPYLGLVNAPVNSLRKIAEAVLDAWPNVQTKCDRATMTDPWKLGRVDRQGVGSRFMLGVVSLGDAQRFGLRTAELQTSVAAGAGGRFTSAAGRTFVAASPASMSAAVALGKQQQKFGVFTWSQKDVRVSGRAYPGTLVVYTAAHLSGLAAADAAKVAQFIRVATTEGQQPGEGNGQLPDGFLPLSRLGTTKPLFDSAQAVAAAVQAQQPVTSSAPRSGSSSAPVVTPSAPASGSGGLTTDAPSPPLGAGGVAPGAAASPVSLGAPLLAKALAATGAPTFPHAAPAPAVPGPGTGRAVQGVTALTSSRIASTLLPTLMVLGPFSALLATGAARLRRVRMAA